MSSGVRIHPIVQVDKQVLKVRCVSWLNSLRACLFFIVPLVHARWFKNRCWSLVKVKKDLVGTEIDARKETVDLSSHKKMLVSLLNTERNISCVDAGEFQRLLNGETKGDNDKSVVDVHGGVEIECEGTFDDENPPAIEGEDHKEMLSLGNEENRASVLNKRGNSQHKPLNKGSLDDSFAKGRLALKNI